MTGPEGTSPRSDAAVWGIHGGRHGEADELFLSECVVALGWDAMGDLARLPGSRDVKC